MTQQKGAKDVSFQFILHLEIAFIRLLGSIGCLGESDKTLWNWSCCCCSRYFRFEPVKVKSNITSLVGQSSHVIDWNQCIAAAEGLWDSLLCYELRSSSEIILSLVKAFKKNKNNLIEVATLSKLKSASIQVLVRHVKKCFLTLSVAWFHHL